MTTFDLENGKILNVTKVCEDKINFINFLEKYPIVVVGSRNGQISLWTTKTAPSLYRFKLIERFMNFSKEIDLENTNITDIGVTAGASKVIEIS